jgi:SPP1 gp7 family putative phage head morphogenesis protein
MAQNQELTEKASRHAVYIQRFAGGLDDQFIPFLDRLRRVVAGFVASTEWSLARQEALLRELTSIQTAIYNEYNQQLILDLNEFGVSESEWQARSLNTVLPDDSVVDVTVPSPQQVITAANTTPMVFPDSDVAKQMDAFIRDWSESEVRRVNNIITRGWITGQTSQEIIREVSGKGGYLDKATRRNNEAIVRTSVNHVSTTARHTTLEENDDIVIGYRWVSTLDSRTSSECRSLDGRVFKFTDSYQPRPPYHPNACLKGTLITTDKGLVPIEHIRVGDRVLTHTGELKEVYTVMARPHDGKARDLIDKFGCSVSLTNEHPILTLSDGWQEVGSIKAGDVFFKNSHKLGWPEWSCSTPVKQSVLLDSHNIKTETTEELISYGIFSSSRGVSSAINLNDSAFDDKVSNKSANSFLEKIFNTKIIKEIKNKLFVKCWVGSVSGLLGFGSLFNDTLNKYRVICLHALAGFFTALSVPFWILLAPVVLAVRLRNKFSIRPDGVCFAPCGDAKFNASFSNNVVREIILSLNEPQAFAKLPMVMHNKLFDFFVTNLLHGKSPSDKWYDVSCTSIVEYHYQGMVYNLAVKDDETYVANGFLVHNCRSVTTPELDGRFKFDDSRSKRPSIGSDGRGTVGSNSTYYGWLKRQTAAFQDETIGKTRGKLLRNGGLTSEEFARLSVDSKFKPLTLDEMKAKDPEAFENAGL